MRQSLDVNGATVTADIETGVTSNAEIKAFLKVTGPNGEQYKAKETLTSIFEGDYGFANLSVEIPDPQLWWPHGYGAQPLYEVEVTLKDGKDILDRRTYKLGLREIELCQEQDQWGKEYTFYVNGVRLFAKGADWEVGVLGSTLYGEQKMILLERLLEIVESPFFHGFNC